MFNSLSRLKVLPPETNVYFGHEYTLNNAIFCQRFDQNNSELNKKILNIKKKLDSGFPSVPSTIKDELNCNIFLLQDVFLHYLFRSLTIHLLFLLPLFNFSCCFFFFFFFAYFSNFLCLRQDLSIFWHNFVYSN